MYTPAEDDTPQAGGSKLEHQNDAHVARGPVLEEDRKPAGDMAHEPVERKGDREQGEVRALRLSEGRKRWRWPEQERSWRWTGKVCTAVGCMK